MNWEYDRPGETPEQARERARRTVADAAAQGNSTAAKMSKDGGCLFFVGRSAAVIASAATLVAFAACREPAAADDPVTWEPIGSAVHETINW